MHSTSSMLGAVKMEGHEHTDWSNYYGEPEVRGGAGRPHPRAGILGGNLNFVTKYSRGAEPRTGGSGGEGGQRGRPPPPGNERGCRAAIRVFSFPPTLPPTPHPRYFSRSARGCPFSSSSNPPSSPQSRLFQYLN